MEELLKQVIEIAKTNYGGHFSIYHFTTNVKGCFGTLVEYGDGETDIREQLANMPAFNSMEELLRAMIDNPKAMEAYKDIPSLPNDRL